MTRHRVTQHRIADTALGVAEIALRHDIDRWHRAADGTTDVGDHAALVLQQFLGYFPATVQAADEVAFRHVHVSQKCFAEHRCAADQGDRPRLDPRTLHVEQQEADAAVLGAGVGAYQAEDPVGVVGVGGPDLLAIDQIVVALIFGAGREAGQIGAGAGLAIALTPAQFAARDGRQVCGLLFLAAVFQQHRAEHADAETEQGCAAAKARHFFFQYKVLVTRQPAAAIGLGPRRYGPAARDHAREPQLAVGIAEAYVASAPHPFAFWHGRAHGGGTVGIEPGADVRAEIIEC